MRKMAVWGFLVACVVARAEEGKWTPQQVLQIDPAWLKQQGLQLPVSRLWDPARGTGPRIKPQAPPLGRAAS